MSFNSKKIKVLYIDDEINNLRSFQASFRRNYEISIASSAAEGMAVLSEKEIHVIIADQRMPQSTGWKLMSAGLLVITAGCVAYLIKAKAAKEWPFKLPD